MNYLSQKRVLLGVTGGIAAYKSAELVRLLRQAGAEVRVVMTRGAREFITPLTLQALSGQPVYSDWAEAEAAMGHIELARWADCVLIAPATADTLARLAQGRADDLLSALCLASEAPVMLAPAMNQAMWAHPATQANAATLAGRGVTLLGPAVGDQACGETGPGRMLEPAELVGALASSFAGAALAGLRVLVTAGPTREAIDPVRCLTNRSSGKMGYAIARAAREAGAAVELVSGPVSLPCPEGVQRFMVESAEQMLAAVMERLPGTHVFIATAAVADYRPRRVAPHKIKKEADALNLELEKTPDILAAVAGSAERPLCVGFAAETEAVEKNAQKKRLRKGVDMIVANLVGEGKGFDADDNELQLFWEGGSARLPRAAKTQLARRLIARIAELYYPNRDSIDPHDCEHAEHSA